MGRTIGLQRISLCQYVNFCCAFLTLNCCSTHLSPKCLIVATSGSNPLYISKALHLQATANGMGIGEVAAMETKLQIGPLLLLRN